MLVVGSVRERGRRIIRTTWDFRGSRVTAVKEEGWKEGEEEVRERRERGEVGDYGGGRG